MQAPVPRQSSDAVALLAADSGLATLEAHHRDALRDWSSAWSHLVQHYCFGTPEAAHYSSVELDFVQGLMRDLDGTFDAVAGPSRSVLVFRGDPRGHLPSPREVWPGYLSCSVDRSIAEQAAGQAGDLWELVVPAGGRAIYLPAATSPVEPGEQEVLIARGSSFILGLMQPRSGGGRLIRLELEP